MMNYNYWVNADKMWKDTIYQTTDAIYKVDEQKMKLYLNALYGKQCSMFKFTNGKGEKGMNRDNYLVLHFNDTPILINKNAIIFIEPDGDNTEIKLLDKPSFIVDERYQEVVRRLFN